MTLLYQRFQEAYIEELKYIKRQASIMIKNKDTFKKETYNIFIQLFYESKKGALK